MLNILLFIFIHQITSSLSLFKSTSTGALVSPHGDVLPVGRARLSAVVSTDTCVACRPLLFTSRSQTESGGTPGDTLTSSNVTKPL